VKPRVLILIPAYNEEQTIGHVIARLRRVVPGFDRLVINDGSRDNTGGVVDELGEKQLQLVTNLGYGSAIQVGLKYALLRGYNIVVTIDADGQHQAEDVPTLVDALIEHDVDMVIGSRFSSDPSYKTSFTRQIGQKLFSLLTRVLIGHRVYDTTSGFKALRAETCEAVLRYTFMDFHIETIVRLSMLGYSVLEVPIEIVDRSYGKSMHSFSSVFQYPLKTLLLIVVAAMDAFIERRTQ